MTWQRTQPDVIFRLRSGSRAGFSAFLSLCTVVAECFQNSAELITRRQPANRRIHARQLRSRQLAVRQALQEWTALEVAKCGTSQVVPRQSEETTEWPRFETVVGPRDANRSGGATRAVTRRAQPPMAVATIAGDSP